MTLHPVKHSAGIVFTTREFVGDDATFHVDGDGATELGGWGHTGDVPEIFENPPADLKAVHVVTVEPADPDDGEADDAFQVAIADLVAEHLERYAECRCWCVGVPMWLSDWVAAGCPVVAEEVDEVDETETETEDGDEEPGGEEELDYVALSAEYHEITGQTPDGRWKAPRLAEEVQKAKVQAAKDRAASARSRSQAEAPAESAEGSGSAT